MSTPEEQLAGGMDPEVIECSNCGARNAIEQDRCAECRIALRSSAKPDWLSQTGSGQQVSDEASDKPMSRKFLWGMWLVFGPWVVFTALFVASTLPDVYYGRSVVRLEHAMRDGVPIVIVHPANRRYMMDIAELAFAIVILLAPAFVLYRTTKRYLRGREPRDRSVGRRARKAEKWYAGAVGLCCAAAWIAVWASEYEEVWIDWREALRFYLTPLTFFGGPALVVVGTVLLVRRLRRHERPRLLWAATLGALAFSIFWWWFCLNWQR